MPKAKYIKYEDEILDLHSQGKTSAEIAIYLRENHKEKATKSSIRSYLKRYFDQKNPNIEQAKVSRKTIKNDYKEALETFYLVNAELTGLINKLTNQDRRKNLYLFAGGTWILTVLSALFIGCYIGQRSSIEAIQYLRILAGISGGILLAFSIALVMIYGRKRT